MIESHVRDCFEAATATRKLPVANLDHLCRYFTGRALAVLAVSR